MHPWEQHDLDALVGRTVAKVVAQNSPESEDGWPELHFTDGSQLAITSSDYDVGFSLREATTT
jgi:hypothetical protein